MPQILQFSAVTRLRQRLRCLPVRSASTRRMPSSWDARRICDRRARARLHRAAAHVRRGII